MGKSLDDRFTLQRASLDPPSRRNSNTLGVSEAIADWTVSRRLEQINGVIKTITIVLIDNFRTKVSIESLDEFLKQMVIVISVHFYITNLERGVSGISSINTSKKILIPLTMIELPIPFHRLPGPCWDWIFSPKMITVNGVKWYRFDLRLTCNSS